jgi:anti-sigma factor RsiW
VSCQPEKVTAYVDGALDAMESARVSAHVDACGECGAQAAFERGLRRSLAVLPAPELPETLEARVRRAVAPSRRRSPLRWLVPMAAGFFAVLLWAHSAPAVVATQLAWDHDHCFGKARLPAKVWTADPGTMISWLESQGTPAPNLPEHVGDLELVGGRHCPLGDRRVAHVYYTGGDHQLSVYVVPGWLRLGHSSQMTRGDKTVRLLRAGGITVGLVSEQPQAVEAFERALTITVAQK